MFSNASISLLLQPAELSWHSQGHSQFTTQSHCEGVSVHPAQLFKECIDLYVPHMHTHMNTHEHTHAHTSTPECAATREHKHVHAYT